LKKEAKTFQLVLLLCCAALPGRAQSLDRVIDCRAAAEIAEQSEGLPPGLLFAIGKIETGRPNPVTGAIEPWPWSTNQGGIGHYFNSAAEAIAWTSQAQAQGLRSIDVGCFQINLFYHSEAFATLEEAFDPVANALYAARFLVTLYRRAGGWPLAVAQYHSADPALGGPYGDRVYSAWNGTWPGGFAAGGGGRTTLTARVTNVPDPFVIRVSVGALGVQVVMPAWASAPAPPVAVPALGRVAALPSIGVPGIGVPGADPVTVRMPHGRRLPRIYEPSRPVLH